MNGLFNVFSSCEVFSHTTHTHTIQVPRVKYVIWNKDYTMVALISKHQLVLATKQLDQLCTVTETYVLTTILRTTTVGTYFYQTICMRKLSCLFCPFLFYFKWSKCVVRVMYLNAIQLNDCAFSSAREIHSRHPSAHQLSSLSLSLNYSALLYLSSPYSFFSTPLTHTSTLSCF